MRHSTSIRLPALAALFLASAICIADDSKPILPPDAALRVIEWKDARKFLGRAVIVQGRILETRNIGSICFLDFDPAHAFTAIVRQSNFKRFTTPPEKMYRDRIVRIRGVIDEYRGNPQIEVTDPAQITLLQREEPIPTTTSAPSSTLCDGVVTVATFNVLNLFDEYDDPYTADEGTPAKPLDQLKKVAATIRSLNADVIALEEVENRGYLERFVGALLPDMGYENIVSLESNDLRGIECAVLSRLTIGPVTSHRFTRFSDGSGGVTQFRRDLLQVHVEPVGHETFDLFVVHLKSKRGTGESTLAVRMAEAREIRRVFDGILKQDPASRFLLCGDFNDTWNSSPLQTIRGGGANALVGFVSDLPTDAKTYNVPAHAEMIDFILASGDMGRRYVAKSCRVLAGSVETLGSDHNPVTARFQLKALARD